MKRLIINIAAVLCASASSLAHESVVGGRTWTYMVSGGEATVTGVSPKTGDLSIPASLGGYAVTSIDSEVFSACNDLTGVTFPECMRRIGDRAFEGCEKLTSAAIPAGVEQVGYRAFANCYALTDVTLPACLEGGMMRSAFARDDETQHPCLWERVTLLGNWEMVMGFEWMTSLVSVTLPGSVREICSYAFRGCTSLKSVTIQGGSAQAGFGGAVGSNAFEGCVNLTSVSIPAGVEEIGDQAFMDCAKLAGVTIPASVRTIGADAFSGCSSLASAALPAGLLRIGDKAFEGCEKLTSAAIPAGVEQVGYRAFANCYALTDVTLPACLEGGMMRSAFARDDETQHPCLWERVTLLGDWEVAMGFDGMTSLVSVTLPGSVREICSYAFRGCTSLKSVTIQGGSAQAGSGGGWVVGPSAFEGCVNLTSVSIPADVEEIGDQAFMDCAKLAGVTIPASVRTIGADAFSGCSSLASAALPAGLLRIGDKAFEGCEKLTSAAIPAGVEQVGYRAFANCYALTDVTLPSCLQSGMMWSVFERDDEMQHPCLWERVTLLGDWEVAMGFDGMTELVSVTLPGSVREICSYAFRGCSSLRDVVFEGNAPMVGFDAFEGVNPSCTAWVKVGSSGWNVEIPGMWNHVKIAYRTDLPSVICGPNLAATQSGGRWTISSVNGSVLTDADLLSVKISATLTGGVVVDVTKGYKVVRSPDGKSATLQLKTPEVGVQPEAGGTEKPADDPSGLLVEVDESELATKPAAGDGESVGALPVKAVKGLWYQASWGDGLQNMMQGEKVQATGDSLYLGVIKQTGASGFYRLSVSEK